MNTKDLDRHAEMTQREMMQSAFKRKEEEVRELNEKLGKIERDDEKRVNEKVEKIEKARGLVELQSAYADSRCEVKKLKDENTIYEVFLGLTIFVLIITWPVLAFLVFLSLII